ncbi:MAG TPA: enoyl-CoA hydratase-related protein [Bordetella sp.]
MPHIQIDNRSSGVTVITLDRPEKRNAINAAMALELQDAFAHFDQSSQRVAVLTGQGESAFSAGADVSDMPEFWRCVPTLGIQTDKPIIMALSGWCVGGALVIAMMADLAVASETTRFLYPEARLGLTGGMIAGLAARIPHKVAMEVMLLGRPLTARRAHEVGLVNEVVPAGTHLAAAIAMAEELAGYAPMVLAALKRFVNQEMLAASPSEQASRTMQVLRAIETSADKAEGVAAFLEKRKPRYMGK